MIDTIGIIGLGMIGGSLAKSLKATHPDCELYAADTDHDAREQALDSGCFSHVTAVPDRDLGRCDVIIVCTPVSVVPNVFTLLAPFLGARSIVTDVAGIKEPVAAWAQQYLEGYAYVGTHPMAGGLHGGFASSKEGIFDGAPVAVSPCDSQPRATEAIVELWTSLGSKPILVSATEHDRRVALTSHLPYLTALAQLHLLDSAAESMVGPGFSRVTHYAEFDPKIMAAVAMCNKSLPQSTRDLANELHRLADILEKNQGSLLDYAEMAQRTRQRTRG